MKTFTTRTFITINIILISLTLASVFWVDKPLAFFVDKNLKPLDTMIAPIISFIETIFGFYISKYLFGFIAIAIGAIGYFKSKKSDIPKIFFFIGVTHIISRLTAGIVKNFFLRPRPFEWLSGNNLDFFSNGNSFPSGHTAHFFGLFLPIVFLYSRYSWIIILPVFVALSRILANDHYLGDVIAAITIAFLFTWTFAKVFKIKTRGKDLYIRKPSH